MSQMKILAGDTVIYGIPTIVGRFLNYFLVPLYAYTLETSEYGVPGELYAYISIFMILLTYGMETAFFRFAQKSDSPWKVYNTALGSLLLSSSFFLLVMLFASSSLAQTMGYADHTYFIRISIIILGLDALRAIPFALLRQLRRAKRFSFIKSVDIFSNIFFNLFFFLVCPWILRNFSPDSLLVSIVNSFFDADNLVLYMFISNLLASFISLLLLLPEFCKFRWEIDLSLWKQMLSYGFPIMIGGLAGMMNETFDRAALKYLVTIPLEFADSPLLAQKYAMSQVGIYSACYKIPVLISLFIQAYRFAAEPFFFAKMKDLDAKSTYAHAMKYMMILLMIVSLGILLYMGILQYFVDAPYREGMKIVPILLLSNLCLGAYYNFSVWYKVSDKTRYGAYIALIGAGITLTCNFLLVPKFGYMGAAWATFFCYLTIMGLSYWWGQRFYPITYPIKRIFLYFLLAVALYAISLMIPSANTLLHYAINSLLFLVYLGAAYIFDFRELLKK